MTFETDSNATPIEDSFRRSSAIASDISPSLISERGQFLKRDEYVLNRFDTDFLWTAVRPDALIIMGDDEAASVGTGFCNRLGK